jgi:hypothetical protein
MDCDTLRLFVVAFRAVVTMCECNMCFMYVGVCVCMYVCMYCMCVYVMYGCNVFMYACM